MSNHGQIAYGKNLDQSFELAQEIENICHQYLNALRIGIPKILSKKRNESSFEKKCKIIKRDNFYD